MSRDLKNLGIDLTKVDNLSNERPQRNRAQVNYNYTKPRKNSQKPPKNSTMPDTPPETPSDSSNTQKDAKVNTNLQTDPNLQGLSETQLQYVNTLITSQMMKVASSMRVVPMNPAINIPIYDEANMTSETFFNQCELYLQSQGFQQPQFHELIRIILGSDPSKKLWYDNVATNIKSWNEFRVAFKAKFDSALVQERRKDRLRRKQHINEPVESYVYEIVNLSRQITPDEDESISVLRAKRGMIPELSLYIGECNTVNELLEKASLAIETIRNRDRMTQRHTRLPPFSIRYESRGSTMQQSSFGRGRGRQSNFQPNNYGRNSNQANSSSQYQNSDSNFRPRLGSAPSRFPSRENSNIICHSCSGQGHIARNCPRKQTSVSTGQNPGTSGTQMVPYNAQRNYQGQYANNSQRLPGNLN